MYWRSLKSLFKLQITILKEMFYMTFTENSSIVKSYVILILAGKTTFEAVPNVGNLREMVALVLTK